MMIQDVLHPGEFLGEIVLLGNEFESQIAENEGDEIEDAVSIDGMSENAESNHGYWLKIEKMVLSSEPACRQTGPEY